MPYIAKLKDFFQQLSQEIWRREVEYNSKLRRFGIEVLRIAHLVMRGVREDNCRLHASALTFSTVMAMVPTLVILFAFAKGFGMNTLGSSVRELIEVPAAAVESAEASETSSPSAPTESTASDVAEDAEPKTASPFQIYLKDTMAAMPEPLKDALLRILDTVESASAGALGGVSVVLFLWIMIRMLNQIEETFNLVWGVKSPRSFMDKIRNYVFVMAVAPALLLLGSAALPTLMALSVRLQWVLGPLNKLIALTVPVLIMALAFAVFYIFLPNIKVRFRSAMAGALTSAVLVVLLQVLMIRVGFGVSRYNMIYGTLAALPIFLFWLQLSWLILLFGAELAFAIQNRHTYAEEQAAVQASTVSMLWVGISLIQEAVRVFNKGEGAVDIVDYAHRHNIPIRLMRKVVNLLSDAHLLGAVSSEGSDAYALLQAPGQISAGMLFERMMHDGSSPFELGLIHEAVTPEQLYAMDIRFDEEINAEMLCRLLNANPSA